MMLVFSVVLTFYSPKCYGGVWMSSYFKTNFCNYLEEIEDNVNTHVLFSSNLLVNYGE